MIGLIGLFVVIITSLLITRIATVMLTLTGLSQESAQFQARSAFSGVGFTTTESESVVNHPVRRRIIMALVLLGNAGVVTVLVSLVLSFSDTDSSAALTRLGFIAVGVLVVWLVSRSRIANRGLSRLIERALVRFTDIDTRDYVGLLRLADNWVVVELEVEPGDWLCDVPLRDLDLPEEGIVVLGIERTDKRWVGAPSGATALHPGDVVLLYGTQDAVDRVDHRHRGATGELDRLTSQVDFTEQYLEQQQLERERESNDDGEGGQRSHELPPPGRA